MNFVSPQSDFIGTTLDGFSHNVTSLSPDIALNVTSIPGDVLDNVTDVSSGKDPLSEDDAPYTEYIEYRVARWILLIYRPFCAVFGVTGNILCIVVVMKTSLRHSPAAIYMVTLAALDWVVSLFAGLTLFPKDFLLGEEDFFSKSWHCRAYYFTLLFVVHFDTLTLVSMTAQRFVAVSFPLHAARWSTKRGTVVTLAFAAGLAFLANVVHLVTFRLQSFDGSYRGRCSVGSGLGEYVQMRVYPWIDSALYFFFPTVTISILNVLIYRAVKKADRFKRTAHTDTESRRGNDRDGQYRESSRGIPDAFSFPEDACDPNSVNWDPSHDAAQGSDGSNQDTRAAVDFRYSLSVTAPARTDITIISTDIPSTLISDARERPRAQQSARVRYSSSAQLTRMLLTVSMAFLFLTLPLGIFVVLFRYWNPTSGYQKALFSLIRDVTESLMFTNHAINFLLYCLSGARFRAKAASIICRACRVRAERAGTNGSTWTNDVKAEVSSATLPTSQS